ncbi:RNA-binding protein 5-like isoform X1 [Drosophila kikkawai]|uniref:RNA-binding protein 5-like isoform X1 n=1 Tax=Drosophila kikkawai TaxID=30033 RepID=A0A6P4HZQ4_DROKI|nr:RNA-binding protein 5-like [Drosophila kikkawai]
MDSRNRRSYSGGSGNDGSGGRGGNSTAYYNRSRSRFSRSRSRSRERNRGFGGGGGGGGGFRHRNSRSRSRSPAFRHDERGGRGGGGGGGDPDLYHNLINEDYRDDERNYNPRNNFNNRQFRREDNFEQNRNHRNNSRDNDRGRDHHENFDNDQRWRDFETRERNSMERSERFQDREPRRPWNRNYSNEHDDRDRSHERMSRPRDSRPNNNGGVGNNRERERDWEHDRDQDSWNHERNQDRHQDRHRRGSSEEDMDEGQMRRNKNGNAQEPLNIIIILGLTMEITRADIMSELIKMNMEPACIRIIRKHGKRFCPDTAAMPQQQRNSSRGIAFVEFTTVEEAKQWMEITQGILKLGDHRLTMQYSHTRIQDWNCSKCGVCNFKFRCYCFVCKTSREEAESVGGSEGVDEVSSILTKKIMLRNLDALTNEEGVLTALQQYLPDLTKTISKVLISRDTLTQASRGICYLHFDTLIDSMNVHNGLMALNPPLTLDDRPVAITYCIDAEELQTGSKDASKAATKASEESHLSRDAAVVSPSGLGGNYTLADVPRLAEYSASLYASNPAEQAHYVQYYTDFYTAEIHGKKSRDPQLTEANSGAAVALSAIQRKQKKMSSIETTITAAAAAAAQAAAEVKASFAAQAISAAPRGNDGKTYPTPDVSQYQYDETSGYYYDRTTGLYYDAHSQYYYNNETGAYLYWDQKRSTYVLATPASTQAALQEVLVDAEQKEEEAKKAKEKEKDKEGGGNKHDKVKVAKKIVKDMEKWAKQLNQKKDYTVVATPQPILSGNDGPSTSRGSQGGYADLGFSILEKKERAKLTDYMSQAGPPGTNKIVNAYGGGSDSEEEAAGNLQNAQGSMVAGTGSVDESDYVDFQKLTCQLCKRAFQSLDILQKHLKMSNLHKENLAKLNQSSGGAVVDEGLSYRDRAKERRLKYGESDPPPPNRSRERFEQEIKTLQTRQKDNSGPAPAMPISSSNVGSRLLQKMGWSEGQGLGRKNQGRTQIIEAEGRTNNVGLGNKAGSMIPGNDYKSYIKKMMKQRYENA